MISPKLLLVEDNYSQQILVKSVLNEYQIDCVAKISDALSLIQKNEYCVAIVDLTLEDGSGLDLNSKIRNLKLSYDIPIVVMSAEQEITNKVTALQSGADDYISKPFNAIEFKARIEAHVERRNRNKNLFSKSTILETNNLKLDLLTKTVLVKNNEKIKNIDFSNLEYKLLVYLLENINRCVSREEIISHVWGNSIHVLDRTVDSKISAIRKKISTYGTSVVSVHGKGYKIEESVSA